MNDFAKKEGLDYARVTAARLALEGNGCGSGRLAANLILALVAAVEQLKAANSTRGKRWRKKGKVAT